MKTRLSKLLHTEKFSRKKSLIRILTGRTGVSSSGYPYISENSFQTFLREIPHLFQNGDSLLGLLARLEKRIKRDKEFSSAELETLTSSIKVLRTIVYSAAVCAPPDLWIVKHVLSVHDKLGITHMLRSGQRIDVEALAVHLQLSPKHLGWDFALLHSRGYLRLRDGRYELAPHQQAKEVLKKAATIESEFLCDMVDPIISILKSGSKSEHALVKRFLVFQAKPRNLRHWFASHFELELGYRLVPLLLALHLMKDGSDITEGTNIRDWLSNLTPEMIDLLKASGIINERKRLTNLGARALERGSGPFGIIHAYHPYMRELQNKLTQKGTSAWVDRGKNIAASQDANRKTFATAQDSLDRFSKDYGFRYKVFIEHALGRGEAVRQRFERSGESSIQYFGADLEDAAIDRALSFQQQGSLPENMQFIRQADIGKPSIVVDAIRRAGFPTEGAVMFVGNGFHEIRGHNNEKIISVFQDYCDAGILIVFTEESALGDQDLLATGWNTYHAGFRYVHELSGQGLRPVYGTDKSGRHSWKICASLGGYAVLSKYSARTRTIYPYPRKGGYNPPISMTYFCVPSDMARRIGCFPVSWGSVSL